MPLSDRPDGPPRRYAVVVADDHPAMRAGVRQVLEADPDVDVVGEAGDGPAALRLALDLVPDVLLLDVDMPGLTGVEVAAALRGAGSPVRVLAFSAHSSRVCVGGLLAAGYITKDEDPRLVVEAVKGVAAGGTRWFVAPAPRSAAERLLSGREQEVLGRLALGRSNQGIALDLHVSESTVRNHLTSVYAKIGAESSREAVAWAWRNGLVPPDPDGGPGGG
jgi:DNA-binding NarL/FixJ family response regulator